MKSLTERCTHRWGRRRSKKIHHATKQEAQRHKRSLPKKRGKPLRVFQCPHCGGWHVGHLEKKEGR